MNRTRKRRHSPFTQSDLTNAARIRGCTCRPDVTRRHVDGIPRVIMRHDQDCPAADGVQLLIRRMRHSSPADFADAVVEIVASAKREDVG